MSLRLALFGNPVAHSLSPRIHRMFGQQLGIALNYEPIETTATAFPADFQRFADHGGHGANLTVPVKQAGRALCATVDCSAHQAGAVNTLVLSDRQWHGYNTDGTGLMMDFDRLGIDPAGRRILILGAGGAARGILGPLLARRPRAITILNRDPERAVALANAFSATGIVQGAGLDGPLSGPAFELIIQATSLGHQQQSPPLQTAMLAPDARAYDLNYGAAHSPFSARCTAMGIVVHDGLGMLVAQAALAFELWTGRSPDPWAVLAGLRTTNGADRFNAAGNDPGTTDRGQ